MIIEISDIDLLKKTIQILSCVIHGHSIRALLRNDTRFLSDKSGADLITLYVKKDEGREFDFITPNRRVLCRLMKKYGFDRHTPSFTKIGNEITKRITFASPYVETSMLYELLKGAVTKKQCEEMKREIRFQKAFFFPLQTYGGAKIGCIGFFFMDGSEPDLAKVREVSHMIQRVVEPLYDLQTSTFYSKCTQIDSDMSRLTDKEREIVHRVIKGLSYKEIASDLKLSINTVKTHMKNIFSKYGVNSKIELNNKLLKNFR